MEGTVCYGHYTGEIKTVAFKDNKTRADYMDIASAEGWTILNTYSDFDSQYPLIIVFFKYAKDLLNPKENDWE